MPKDKTYILHELVNFMTDSINPFVKSTFIIAGNSLLEGERAQLGHGPKIVCFHVILSIVAADFSCLL